MDQTTASTEGAEIAPSAPDPAIVVREPAAWSWPTVVVLCLLFAGFWTFYYKIGRSMEAHSALRNNMFFHSDIARVVVDMTRPDSKHLRTNVHPLFVLFANPIGSGLTKLLGSRTQSAILFNSCFGGLTVALTCLFLRKCRVSLHRSLLGALLLGFSASHLYFGSAPETFIFSCLGIILLFMGLIGPPRGWRYFVPVGVFNFGILITNLAFVVIAYAASVSWASWKKGVRQVALLAVAVVAISGGLALAQRAIWPTTVLFFQPKALSDENRFEHRFKTVARMAGRESSLVRHIFIFDFFAPKTVVSRPHTVRQGVLMRSGSMAYLPSWGKVAAVLWVALLAAALIQAVKSRLVKQPMMVGLVLCVLFNFFLHTIYGDDLFLYSCNTCFCLVAWTVLGLSERRTPRFALIVDLVLLALVSAEVVNNVRFMKMLTLTRFTVG